MSSHDVRKLAICTYCGAIGMRRGGLLQLVPGTWVHPKCIAPETLLALPQSELDTVRICDVPTELMRRLIEKADEARRNEAVATTRPICANCRPVLAREENVPIRRATCSSCGYFEFVREVPR